MSAIANPQTQPGYQPVSMPMPAPRATEQQLNSLWASNRRSFFEDQRARDAGDILVQGGQQFLVDDGPDVVGQQLADLVPFLFGEEVIERFLRTLQTWGLVDRVVHDAIGITFIGGVTFSSASLFKVVAKNLLARAAIQSVAFETGFESEKTWSKHGCVTQCGRRNEG